MWVVIVKKFMIIVIFIITIITIVIIFNYDLIRFFQFN